MAVLHPRNCGLYVISSCRTPHICPDITRVRHICYVRMYTVYIYRLIFGRVIFWLNIHAQVSVEESWPRRDLRFLFLRPGFTMSKAQWWFEWVMSSYLTRKWINGPTWSSNIRQSFFESIISILTHGQVKNMYNMYSMYLRCSVQEQCQDYQLFLSYPRTYWVEGVFDVFQPFIRLFKII